MGLIPPRNPLAFPSGVPAGINQGHVALSGGPAVRFSGVARNGSFIDLARGGASVRVGTPARVIDGNLGDSVQYAAASATTFSGRKPTPELNQQMTFGAIVKWTNFAASTFSFIFANSTNTTGYNGFFAGNDGSVNIRYSAINYGTSPVLANNIPYFVAASAAPVRPINFVVRRLDTGQIVYLGSPAGAGSYSDAPNGNYVVGNWPLNNSFGLVGQLAAVAYTNAYLSLPLLLEWAQNPWDFWYPPTAQQTIFASLRGGTSSVAATVAETWTPADAIQAATSLPASIAETWLPSDAISASLTIPVTIAETWAPSTAALADLQDHRPNPPPVWTAQIPYLRETTYRRRFLGVSFDPTLVITKERPGPLRIIEVDFWNN